MRGCVSGTPRLRRKISLLFGEESFKQFVSIHLFLKQAQHHILRSLAVHKTGVRQDMVLGFLVRNEFFRLGPAAANARQHKI